jgi:hypothetical protein
MRTISKTEVNQLVIHGAKIRKLTHSDLPRPSVEHTDQLSALERSNGTLHSNVAMLNTWTQEQLGRQKQIIDHLAAQVHALNSGATDKPVPTSMSIKRGQQGFISEVVCGRLVFTFNRDNRGTCRDIGITTK